MIVVRVRTGSDASCGPSAQSDISSVPPCGTDGVADRDARGGGAHERNCRRDRGAELQSEAT